MKNTSRNKFLLCFRPVVDMDVMLESRGVLRSSNNRGLICESDQDKGIAKTSSTKSVSSDDGFSDKSLNLKSALHRRPNRKLSRVIRAVVFETILRRRVRERRRRPKYITNNENSGDQKQITHSVEVKRVTRSPPPSSSSGSNISSSTTSNSEEVKQNQNKGRANAAVNKKTAEMDCYIIYLVLAVMIFTVFWGKLGGILCTSVWLYCHPHRRSSCSASRQMNRSSRSLRQSPETTTRRESSWRREKL